MLKDRMRGADECEINIFLTLETLKPQVHNSKGRGRKERRVCVCGGGGTRQ